MTKPKLTYFDRKSFIWRIPGKEMDDKNIKYIKLLTSNQKIREDLKYLNLQKTEKYTRVAHCLKSIWQGVCRLFGVFRFYLVPLLQYSFFKIGYVLDVKFFLFLFKSTKIFDELQIRKSES